MLSGLRGGAGGGGFGGTPQLPSLVKEEKTKKWTTKQVVILETLKLWKSPTELTTTPQKTPFRTRGGKGNQEKVLLDSKRNPTKKKRQPHKVNKPAIWLNTGCKQQEK